MWTYGSGRMHTATKLPRVFNSLKPRDPRWHTLSVMGSLVIPAFFPKHFPPVFWLYNFLQCKLKLFICNKYQMYDWLQYYLGPVVKNVTKFRSQECYEFWEIHWLRMLRNWLRNFVTFFTTGPCNPSVWEAKLSKQCICLLLGWD